MDARTFEVRNELFSLMIDCGADDRHLESPVLDELVEVTPASIRLRKRILDPSRRKTARKAEAEADG